MKLTYYDAGWSFLWGLSYKDVGVVWICKPTKRQQRKAAQQIYRHLRLNF